MENVFVHFGLNIFCNFAAEIKGVPQSELRLYPMNLEQVMLFRETFMIIDE